MGQRVHPGDGQGKIRVVFKGQREAQSLDGQTEAQRIAVKRFGVRRGFQGGKLLRCEDGFIHLAGVYPLADEFDRAAHRQAYNDLNRFWKNRPV